AEGRKEGEQVGLKKGRKEGEQAGLKKGKAEGRKEGEQVGLKKGKAEGRQEGEQLGLEKAQIKIATQMILAHLPSEQVSTLTGLDAARVAQLVKQLGQ
ncbi:MAG: DUF4351 domain-containing protein, partial [Bacteroidota bacterium]